MLCCKPCCRETFQNSQQTCSYVYDTFALVFFVKSLSVPSSHMHRCSYVHVCMYVFLVPCSRDLCRLLVCLFACYKTNIYCKKIESVFVFSQFMGSNMISATSLFNTSIDGAFMGMCVCVHECKTCKLGETYRAKTCARHLLVVSAMRTCRLDQTCTVTPSNLCASMI